MMYVNSGDLHIMPRRKTHFANENYYHLYNRGVEKRIIFNDKEDYNTFLEILTYYLVPRKDIPEIFSRKPQIKISDGISLLSFALMPNHFHFLVRQNKKDAIVTLMNSLGITYAKYFNKKNKRVGSLFQGRFKAKMIDNDEYLLHLSKYIHLNPKDIWEKPLSEYPYSSYRFYVHGGPKDFIDTETVLSYFTSSYERLSYAAFVEDVPIKFSAIENLTLE